MRTLFKALAAFALTLFIAACSGGGTPEKTAEQFIRTRMQAGCQATA